MGLLILAIVLLLASVGVGFIACLLLDEAFVVFFCIAALVSGLVVWSSWGSSFRNDHYQVCTVTGKDRGGDDGSYRIYTKECDTLGNEDSILRGKYNSSNIWEKIEPGNTYQFRIVGSRVPFLSQFPNVLEVERVN